VVDTKILGRVGDSVQKLISRPELTFGALRTKASDLEGLASKADDPALARAYRAMADSLDDMRAKSGAASPELDLGYAQFKRLEKAAASAMTTDGVFSVGQLRSAVRGGSEVGQRARGGALLQGDLSKASGVLGETIPAMGPGTAEKLMLGAGLPAGAAYMLGHPLVGAGVLSAAGAGKLAYTPAGAKFLTGGYPWQQRINPALMGAMGGTLGALPLSPGKR
jgi:hypothetical protein